LDKEKGSLASLPSKQVVQTNLDLSEVKEIWDYFNIAEVTVLEG
jgi:hypothetical protein